MNWAKVRLESLYEVHNGLAKGRKYFGEGYPFLSFSTVFNNFFLPDELVDLVQSTEKERTSYSIKRGDVFVTRTSETAHELGMSCVALKDYPDATYNGFTKRMRPTTDKVLPEFIGYYMRTPEFRDKFQAFSTMTTRASLRNEDLLGIEISLPNKEIQQRIADVLSNYDALIANLQQQIKLLEEAAQRLYKEWFLDLRFPGWEKAEILDGVPSGWKQEKLGEIALFKRGKTITKSKVILGDIPVVAGGLEPAYYHNKSNTEAPVITVSASGANAGYTRLYYRPVFASDCSYVDKTGTDYLYFVYSYLRSNQIVMNSLQKGSAQPHVYAKDINAMDLVIPNYKIMKRYCEVVTPLFQQIKTANRNCELLQEARDRLLPKLISGEIEVSL